MWKKFGLKVARLQCNTYAGINSPQSTQTIHSVNIEATRTLPIL